MERNGSGGNLGRERQRGREIPEGGRKEEEEKEAVGGKEKRVSGGGRRGRRGRERGSGGKGWLWSSGSRIQGQLFVDLPPRKLRPRADCSPERWEAAEEVLIS